MKFPIIRHIPKGRILILAVLFILVLSYAVGISYVYFIASPAHFTVSPLLRKQPDILLTPTPSYEFEISGSGKPTPERPLAPSESIVEGGITRIEYLEKLGRMVIVYATIEIKAEPDEVMYLASKVEEIAFSVGGFIAESNIVPDYGGYITIRIPSEKFEETLKQIEQLGKVIRKSISTEDVTDVYVDLEARLRNCEAREARLLALLNQCSTVKEVLMVEEELSRVRGEIESIKGQMRYLKNRVDYSTITVSITVRKKPPFPTIDLYRLLTSGLKVFYAVVQGLIIITMGLLPIALVVYPIYKIGLKIL